MSPNNDTIDVARMWRSDVAASTPQDVPVRENGYQVTPRPFDPAIARRADEILRNAALEAAAGLLAESPLDDLVDPEDLLERWRSEHPR